MKRAAKSLKKVEYAGSVYEVIQETTFLVTLRSIRDRKLKIKCNSNSVLLRNFTEDLKSVK